MNRKKLLIPKDMILRIRDEAREARINGKPITANPYISDSEKWSAWREGYEDASGQAPEIYG